MKQERPRISREAGGGPFPAHVVEVISRIGSPEDPAGEHANVEIVSCDLDPSCVGTRYRLPIAGGPAWEKKIDPSLLEEARKAPHILDKPETSRTPGDDPRTSGEVATDAEGCSSTSRTAEDERRRREELETRPVLFLTNAAAVRAVRHGTARDETAKRVGPGDHYSIQASPDPKRGELGAGIVWFLAPFSGTIDSVRKSRLSLEQYRERYLSAPPPPEDGRGSPPQDPRSWIDLSPGSLRAVGAFGSVKGSLREVQAGDTLTCSCSAKDAAVGLCHRTWAAALLLDAGWRVVLDGVEIDPAKSAGLLELAPEGEEA